MMGVGMLELVDMDTPIEYSTTAVSAINGLKDILQEMSERMMNDEPDMPILWLGREQFTAQGQTNWKPTFNIETWVTREAVTAFLEEKLTIDGLVTGEAPKKKRAAPKKKRGAKK